MLDLNTLFDERYYLATNPDVANAVSNGTIAPLQHFITFGQFERRDPSAIFDTDYYLSQYLDVADAVRQGSLAAVEHYLNFGQREGRDPGLLYDQSFYLSNNPDVAAAVAADRLTGIEHFLNFGEGEDRTPSRFYNPAYYLDRNPDVAAAVAADRLTGIQHYLEFGAIENRELSPFIEPGGSSLPNGVAAGDVTQTSAMLWARTTTPGPVNFEWNGGVAEIVATDALVPVKLQLDGLQPNTEYTYTVSDSGGAIATGKFRTLASPGTRTGLRFGVSGDWQGELAPYPSISNADSRNLDFFVQVGDTLEADSSSPDLPGVRQASSLLEFYTKHNEIYSERFGLNPWVDLRQSTATYSTWDDHDITNDFAGGAAPSESPQRNGIFGTGEGFVNETPVFREGLQAFQEFKPLQDQFYGETGDPRTANKQKLYRFNTHGSDAASFILDTRSFRDKPLPFLAETASEEEIAAYLQDAFEPGRTLLGRAQLEQLKTDLLTAENSGVTWKFVMSSVPMQHFGIPVAGERWEGYAAERTELLKFIEDNDIDNVVFVTGDFHGNAVNNVTYQEGFGQPQIQTGAMDVMVGPVGIQLNIGQGPFAAPFGPATVAFTPDALLPQSEKERYRGLTDVEEKNAFVRQVIDNRIVPLGYDPVGLEGSNIDARLLQGSYFAAHNYGWTEFEIDRDSQVLTVTTWGVEPYTERELEANPEAIASRTPTVRMQFEVTPETL
ncbi:alkaline phosphatase D family protein [Oxynema sp. CENA135]|uniref:alkaline phosphatase D family protein n=1 Tax=Oxynema sp. CENA135 TaxID=984206 RepID=UPI00190ACA7E|nr:alkaline phosphatase D family protein [Oxynema sp. CENA135]MBK4730900.1 alkaline phosphatase D family protein [Oxynema sp. CENA135]